MASSQASDVEIVEVGPREGFRPIGPFIATKVKVEHLRRQVVAGLRRIEIGSFVSEAAMPQLRGTPDLLAACADDPEAFPQVLVPSR